MNKIQFPALESLDILEVGQFITFPASAKSTINKALKRYRTNQCNAKGTKLLRMKGTVITGIN